MAKLLIVDDEQDIREFATSFFKKRKIEVTTASSGEEALSLFEKGGVDLILLDIKMDSIDGCETLRLLREKDKEVKVIMVTGRKPEEEDSFERCRQLGALAYIHKPLELDELEKIVLGYLFPDKKQP